MKGFKFSKVTVVLRRWKSETMKFGMKRDDHGRFSLPVRSGMESPKLGIK